MRFSVKEMYKWIEETKEFQRIAGVPETSSLQLAEDFMDAYKLTNSEKSVIRAKFLLTSAV